MENQQPRDSLEALINSLQILGFPLFNKEFFSTLGVLQNPNVDDIISVLNAQVMSGKFDYEDFEMRKSIFLNPEIIETLIEVAQFKDGGKSQWPYLAQNLELLFNSFSDIYLKRGRTQIDNEWIFPEVAGEIGKGKGYMIKWEITPANIGINPSWIKINQKIRSLLKIPTGDIITELGLQRVSYEEGELAIEILKVPGHLSVYLYGSNDISNQETSNSVESAIKIWKLLRQVSPISINANPAYRTFLSQVIGNCEAREIPKRVMNEILLPILSIPTSKLGGFHPEIPPYFIDNKDSLLEIFLEHFLELQRSSTLEQISTFLAFFGLLYMVFFAHVKRKLFVECFGYYKNDWTRNPKYTVEQVHRFRDLVDLHPNIIMMLAPAEESLKNTDSGLRYIFRGLTQSYYKSDWYDATIDVFFGCVRLAIQISERAPVNGRNRVYFSLELEEELPPRKLKVDKRELKHRFEVICEDFEWVDKGDTIFAPFDQLFASWQEFIPCASKNSKD